MQGLKEMQTSKASEKTLFLKYDIISNGQYKFAKRRKCKPGHEKLRATARAMTFSEFILDKNHAYKSYQFYIFAVL